MHIIKTTVSILTKFFTVIKTSFKCPLWVVQIRTSQISYKMTDGRRLGKIEKSPYLSNDEIN